MSAVHLISETNNLSLDKWRFDDAERKYQIVKNGGVLPQSESLQCPKKCQSSLVNEIAKARQHIQKSLKNEGQMDNVMSSRIEAVEMENKDLRKVTQDLSAIVKKLEARITALETGNKAPAAKAAQQPSKAAKKDADEDDDDDDFDIFDSDDEDDEEKERIKQERIDAYTAKKSKKPTLIAKSNVIIDVKPWDDETDMVKVEECVRAVKIDGLLWGAGRLVPVGYGIKKLTISSVVEDDKVSMDDVEEQICANEDLIQSMDIVAFNKI